MKKIIRIYQKKWQSKKIFQKRLSYFGMILTGLFFLNFIFKTYTNEIVGAILKEIIQRDSKGLYRLEYEELDLRVVYKELSVKGLRLIPDSTKVAQLVAHDTLKTHNIFEATVTDAFIGVENIPSIYLDRELTVTGIQITNPNFKMVRYTAPKQKTKPKKKSFEIADIQEIVLENLRRFKINFFKIHNASFEVTHYEHTQLLSSYALSNVSITLDDFHLDSLSGAQQSKAFFTEDLDITIKNYSLNLADGIHILRVNEVGVSTGKSELYLDSLSVFPKDNLTAEDSAKGLYDIKVPSLKIQGLNFEKAYFQNHILIENIVLSQPSVKILAKIVQDSLPKINKKEKINQQAFLRSILNYSPSISIRKFHLNKASLDFSMNQKNGIGAIVHDISFVLENFHLDSNNIESRAKHLYSDHVSATVKNHTFNLPDGIHKLKVGEVGISTSKSEVYATNVHVEPKKQSIPELMHQTDVKDFYDLHLPEMRISGIDLWTAYIQSIFNIEKIQITSPNMHFYNREKTQKNKHKKRLKKYTKSLDIINLYPLVSPFFTSLKVEEFTLDSGTFKNTKFGYGEQNDFKIGNTSLSLSNFELNEKAYKNRNKILYADEIEVFIKSHSFDLPDSIHVLQAGDLFLSTSKSIIRLGASNIHPKYQKSFIYGSRYNMAFQEVELSGIDVRRAYFNREYYAKKLRIRKPEIIAELHPKKAPPPMASIQNQAKKEVNKNFQKNLKAFEIQEVVLDSGKLSLVRPETNHIISAEHFEATLKPFRLDSAELRQRNIIPETDSVEFEGKNYSLALPKIQHFLKIKKLGISSSQALIYLDSLKLYPLQKSKNQINILFPELFLRGINVADITSKKRLKGTILEVQKPFFDLRINTPKKSGQKKFRLENLYDLFRNSLENITLSHVKLDSGQFFWSRKFKKQSLKLTNFDLKGSQFLLSGNIKMTNDNFIFAKKWELSAKNIWHQSLKNRTEVENLNLNTGKNNYISAKNLHVFSIQDTSQTVPSKFDFQFPKVEIENFDFYRIYAFKDLILENAILEKPYIKYVQKKETYSTKKFRLDSLNAKILTLLERHLRKIKIRNLNAKELSFDIQQIYPQKIKKYSYDDISLKINNFNPKKSLISSSKVLFSDDITAKIKNYHLSLRDSLHQVKIKEIGFSTRQKQVWIDSLSYFPKYRKYEISKKQKSRTNWIRVDVQRLLFDSLQVNKLVENQAIISKKLELTNFQTEIFTENSQPDPPLSSQKTIHQILTQSKNHLKIDTVYINNGTFSFTTHPKEKVKAGQFFMNHIHGKVINLNSKPNIHVPNMQIEIYSDIMGQGELQVLGIFNLYSPHQTYRLSGNMQEVDLKILNDFLGTIAPLNLKSGKIRNLQFEMLGDAKRTIGKMSMFYNNLKIKVIRKHKFGEALFSFIANTFVLDRNNYKFSLYRKAKMYDEREITESIFTHWIQTLISGVKINLGLKSRKVNNQYKAHETNLLRLQ